MSNCEQAQAGFSKILEAIPDEYQIKMHGSFRYPVYPGWKANLQNNDDLHLLYVWGGEGCYHMLDGNDIRLQNGTLVFISHGIPHRASVNLEDPVKIAGLRFGIYDKEGNNRTKEATPIFYYSYRYKNYHGLNDMTWKIHQFYHKKKDSIHLKICNMLIFQILNELYQTAMDNPLIKNDDMKLEMIRQSIEAQPFQRVSIQLLAKENGMSTRHLQKLFKKAYSFTPKEYHQNIQMNIAYTLLTQNGLSVSKVAEMLGYSDAFCFSKQFKKHFGYAPTHAANCVIL